MQNLDFYANEPWLKSRSGIDARNKPSIFFLLPFCFSKFVVYFFLSNFRYFLFFYFLFQKPSFSSVTRPLIASQLTDVITASYFFPDDPNQMVGMICTTQSHLIG